MPYHYWFYMRIGELWWLQKYSTFIYSCFTILPFLFMDKKVSFTSVQFSAVTQSCLTLCDPKDCSMPGLPVHQKLSKLTQSCVHWTGDAIQPSHTLSSPSPAFNLSQHQGPFQWVSSSHQVAKYWRFSFSISPSNEYSDWLPLGWTGWISLWSKRLSRVFSNTTVKKHQFFRAQLSL